MHGPHQGAQKSTITGTVWLASTTSAMKFASDTSFIRSAAGVAAAPPSSNLCFYPKMPFGLIWPSVLVMPTLATASNRLWIAVRGDFAVDAVVDLASWAAFLPCPLTLGAPISCVPGLLHFHRSKLANTGAWSLGFSHPRAARRMRLECAAPAMSAVAQIWSRRRPLSAASQSRAR